MGEESSPDWAGSPQTREETDVGSETDVEDKEYPYVESFPPTLSFTQSVEPTYGPESPRQKLEMPGGDDLGAVSMRPSEPREWPWRGPIRREVVPSVPERVSEGQLQRDPVLAQIKKDFLDTMDDPVTRDWFTYAQHIFPIRKSETNWRGLNTSRREYITLVRLARESWKRTTAFQS